MKKIFPIEGIIGLKRNRGLKSVYHFFLEHYALWWWRFTEAYETQLVRASVKPGATAVDVGANIGYYTLQFAKLVGPSGKVFAFEPDPTNFSVLEKNVRRYGFRNVVCLNQAVCDRSGTVQLYLSEGNPGDHRIYDSSESRQSIAVSAVRLDDYFARYPDKIDFIKIDVQGAEDSVLRGMSGLLNDKSKTAKLAMLTELWPTGLKNFGVHPKEYLNRLVDHGFHMNCIMSHSLKPLDIDTLLTGNLEGKYINLLCSR